MCVKFRSVSAVAAWLVLAATLVIGVPLFLRMPLWVDATYHDLSARNILWGGVHYRDIFETNLPGMVWLHALVRTLLGWTSEALRAVDLAVVSGSVALLWFWLRRVGVSHAGRTWFAVGALFFYVFETEFIHCQRDVWMLLPTIVALHLRGRQLARAPGVSRGRVLGGAWLEGVVWGCAVWIKPHALVPALFVWGASLGALRSRRGVVVADTLGLLAGGAMAGIAGSAWLIATGTWPHMWDVLLNWNGEYYRWSLREMDMRASAVIMYFAPWSLVHLAAIPVALVASFRARVWQPGNPGETRLHEALLAALYLGWLTQATFLQRTFHYSQAPPLFLALAVVAARRWPVAQVFIAWCLVAGFVRHYGNTNEAVGDVLERFRHEKENTYKQLIPWHRLTNPEQFGADWRSIWWQCVRGDSTPALKDQLSFYHNIHCAPTWTELDEVRQFLETLNLKDGELICWDDSTHPLYLDLGIRPGVRYMHVNTVLDTFRTKRPLVRQELIDGRARHARQFVVSDTGVTRFLYGFYSLAPPPGRPLDLPIEFPCFCRDVFPWDQPIVFKAGRYFVHEITNPIEAIRVPHPVRIDMP